MDFAWSEEQRELFDGVVEFASKALNDDLIENDREGRFNRRGWDLCGEFGIQGLLTPKQYGGLGFDALTAVGALERLGYACQDNGLIFSINAHMWTAIMPLLFFGSEAQKERYMKGLSDGSIVSGNAMSEPGSGSDAYAMRTTAEKRGDRYVLNGSKIWVTNGPVADVIVVFATVDRDKGARGVTAFVVDKGTPGLSAGKKLEKMGLRTSPMSELFFDDCEIPEENRIGKEGQGAQVFTHSMNWERGCILSSAVGSMERLLETSIGYANDRKQFGQPIGKFQQVASKLVDMKLRLETSRQMLYHGAWMRAAGKAAVLEACLTKLHLSESWVRCCEDAIQIHGGSGYMVEYQLEREMRDAMGSRIYSGTNEIQRNIAAAMLGA